MMNPSTTLPVGLLWPRTPLNQPLDLTARNARRRFIEREGCEPVGILINPTHQADLQIVQTGSQEPTLIGLPVGFDKMVRPHHVLILAPDEEYKKVGSPHHEAADRLTPTQR